MNLVDLTVDGHETSGYLIQRVDFLMFELIFIVDEIMIKATGSEQDSVDCHVNEMIEGLIDFRRNMLSIITIDSFKNLNFMSTVGLIDLSHPLHVANNRSEDGWTSNCLSDEPLGQIGKLGKEH